MPLSPARLAGGECPSLAGRYALRGQARTQIARADGTTTKPEAATIAIIRQWHPTDGARTKRSLVALDQPVDRESFWIVQDSPERFDVRWPHQDGVHAESLSFDRGNGDFTCMAGVVLLRQGEYSGASEGVTTSFRRRVRIARGPDKSIIYHDSIASRASSLLWSNEQVVDSFKRFPLKP
jgi:hypothetical protein